MMWRYSWSAPSIRQGGLPVELSLFATLIILGAALGVAIGANIWERRPHAPGQKPLLPLVGIQFVAGLIVLLMIVHLITIFTGQSQGPGGWKSPF
jgi:uncharacterized membrane protein YidH (DUF202 family)